ncbi:SpaH/EbpB family LPXTG-anchored major pilin [Leucobacter sp. GX0328]
MTTSTTRRSYRLAAAVGALAVGAIGLFGATAAQAAPGNIDTTTPGSVTIHKHLENSSAPAAPDGSGSVSGAAVAGVEFEIYELNYNGQPIDLTQFDDWEGLADVQLTDTCDVASPSDYSLGALATTVTTTVDGSAVYNTGTARQAYVVCETDTSGATVAGEPVNIVKKAAPFVVSVPMPYEDEWLYAVHAYPKNTVAGITKTIDSQPADGLGLGSEITFPVTTDIPNLAEGDELTGYIVRDRLDDRLSPVSVKSVTVDGDDVDASFYDIKVNATDAQDIRVVFNQAGLDWLETQGGKQIVTVFAGTVVELGDGIIPNEATLFVNDPDADSDTTPNPGIPSNEVESHWGDVIIQKSDAANDKNLSGATFQVYSADPAYVAEGTPCTSKVTTGAAISVNGEDSFTTGTDGKVIIDGLFVSDSENEPKGATQRCYVIVETAAPAGYTLPTGDAAKTAVTVKTGQTTPTAFDVDVPNTKQDVPELPLTGAAGQTLMVLGGAALIAIATGLVLARRRRAAQL